MTSFTTEPKESRVNIPLLVLFLLSLILNGYLLYTWYQSNYSGGKSLKEQNMELREILSQSEYSLDSLQEQYNLLETQYQNIMTEFETVRVERDEALSDVDSKKVRIRQLISQVGANPKNVVALRTEIEELKKVLVDKRIELDAAVQAKEKYKGEAETTLVHVATLKKEKAETEKKAVQLEDKLRNAKFQIDELVVSPLRSRRGKFETTDKASKIDHVEISFAVVETELIEFGDKEIVLRILGINGEVLGADNTTLVDSDKLITMKQSFNYQGDTKKLSFKFKQEELYKKGGHTAEIWHNGERLVRTQFNLE